MTGPRRVVFDCNVFLQAMLSVHGPASVCLVRVDRGEVILIVSPYVLAEVRALPEHPDLRRFPSLTPERVEQFLSEVLQRAELVVDVPEVFKYLQKLYPGLRVLLPQKLLHELDARA